MDSSETRMGCRKIDDKVQLTLFGSHWPQLPPEHLHEREKQRL